MEQVVFGIHTATLKHVITLKEVHAVKKFFGVDNIDKTLEDETHFYEKGITKIWIQEIPTKQGTRYFLFMQINFTRALGIGIHKIMTYSTANVKKAIRAVNKVLKILPLLDKNSDFKEWTVERIDTVFDICEQDTPLLMQLLNYSLDLGDSRKKCRRMTIPGKPPEQVVYESMRFGNDSYVYNVYVKLTEVLEKAKKNGRTVTPEEIEEVQNILRIERQNHASAVKNLLPYRKVGDLADDKVRADILKVMIDEAALFFGTGDFYAWREIEKRYLPEHKADIDTIKNAMAQITLNSLEAVQEQQQEVYTKEVSGIFARLGISPVGIKKVEAEQYKAEYIQGIYSRITAAYPRPPDKRQYNSFPVPHRTGDGRFKATITLYHADSGRKQLQIAGKTLEDYEGKVLNRLRETYLLNRLYIKSADTDKHDMVQKSADSVKRFTKVSKTAAKQEAEKFIESVIMEDEKRFNSCPPATGGSLTVSDYPNSI